MLTLERRSCLALARRTAAFFCRAASRSIAARSDRVAVLAEGVESLPGRTGAIGPTAAPAAGVAATVARNVGTSSLRTRIHLRVSNAAGYAAARARTGAAGTGAANTDRMRRWVLAPP
jgi:hypothetical protein